MRWATAFHRACVEAGIPPTPDYNGAQYEGVGILQTNTRRGLRLVAARPTCDPHAVVQTCACAPARAPTASASRTGRAVGVEYRVGAERRFVRACRR